MARGTPAAVTTPFRAESSTPVILVAVDTGGVPAVVRYTDYDGDVEWGGYTWGQRSIKLDEIQLQAHSESPGTQLVLGDADLNYKALEAAGAKFIGQRVRIYRTDLTAIQAGAGVPSDLLDSNRDDFFIESWDRAIGAFRMELVSLVGLFDRDVPLGTVTRTEFPGIPDANSL